MIRLVLVWRSNYKILLKNQSSSLLLSTAVAESWDVDGDDDDDDYDDDDENHKRVFTVSSFMIIFGQLTTIGPII